MILTLNHEFNEETKFRQYKIQYDNEYKNRDTIKY